MPSMTDVTWPADTPPDFHFLAKPSRSTCNIDCFFLSHPQSRRAAQPERSDETAAAQFRFRCIFLPAQPANATQNHLKEGTNHGYKATQYPDPLGR
jgi:hypothetical protein